MSSTSGSSEVSLDDLSLNDHDRCAICLGNIEGRTGLDMCTHTFCRSCILTWAKNKLACPLCNTEFLHFHANLTVDGTFDEEEVPVPVAKKPDLSSDLECLDQGYFISEALRLRGIAEEAQRSIVRSQKQNSHSKFGSKFASSWEARNWDSLSMIVERLNGIVHLLRSDSRIDPMNLLDELYQLQGQMDLTWRVPFANEQIEISSTTRYSADDYDDLSSDSEDEYCNYDMDGGRYSKKDRKPSGRIPKRPTPLMKKK